MTLSPRSLPALLLLVLTCWTAPLQAQDPGFDAENVPSPSPGFDAPASVAKFDWNALKIDNSRLDLSKNDAQQYVRAQHGLSLDDNNETIAYKGIFASTQSDSPQLLVIDIKNDQVRLYEGSSLRARYNDLGLVSKAEAKALDLPERAIVAQITQEGTMELIVWRKTSHKKATHYHMSVLKVVGSYFGKAFSHEVAKKSSSSSDITPTAQIDVFQSTSSKNNISFGVTSTRTSRTKLYTWDRWSGTFSDPNMLPKATKKTKS